MFYFLYVIFSFVSVGLSSAQSIYFPITSPIGHTEGPHWDSRTNILYFVSIFTGQVFAYHHESKLLANITLDGNVSPVVPSRNSNNTLFVGLDRDVVMVEWDGKNELQGQRNLTTVSPQFPDTRFNDGKADAEGRLWWGTISPFVDNVPIPDQAVFYTITKYNLDNPTVAAAPVTNSNGLAWNKANNKLYYIDTATRKVVEFDYNNKDGTISRQNRTVFDVKDWATIITGDPDGMTIDTEDNLYIALYGGEAVIKVNPTSGKLLKVIDIPAKSVTSVMWGGPNLDVLYVTTSNLGMSPEDVEKYPDAGSVFAVTGLEAKGFKAHNADILPHH